MKDCDCVSCGAAVRPPWSCWHVGGIFKIEPKLVWQPPRVSASARCPLTPRHALCIACDAQAAIRRADQRAGAPCWVGDVCVGGRGARASAAAAPLAVVSIRNEGGTYTHCAALQGDRALSCHVGRLGACFEMAACSPLDGRCSGHEQLHSD